MRAGDEALTNATQETRPSAGGDATTDLAPGSHLDPGVGAPGAGELIGRYQIRRKLAEGGMGQVFLARDTMLGRSVALKLVRHLGGDPEAFVREARITAQLNHPHIVQLHDVGRFGAHTYLALEFLTGESLWARWRREPPSADESLRILRAIAEALAHAHALGVIHCDLKPANVMLPDDGRVRVVDFGLATMGRARLGTGAAGTPDWMAPEQWRDQPTSDRTDVWALAIIASQLLTGAHPFGAAASSDERRRSTLDLDRAPATPGPGVPDRLRPLLVRSLSRDPAGRPTARDWVTALDDELRSNPAGGASDGPFRGLAAFDERHAALYFGRELEVDAFLERLREQPFLPIVGPSGVGKSSFLFAGVVPRLRARGHWIIVSLRPGADPFQALAHRLLAATEARPDAAVTAGLAAELYESPSLLGVRLATIAAAGEGQVLLAVDQLEELFTQHVAPDVVERFLRCLAVADDAAEPVRITFTLRDDFLWRVPAVRSLFVIRALDGADLRATITAPLDRLGYRFDDASVVDEMLAEARGTTVDLPLVQFTCRALWEARDRERHLLLGAAYRELGGVAGALARHADKVIAELTPDEQRLSRQLFGRLVVGTSTRRIVARDALLDGLPGAEPVLDRLLDARLLVQQRPPGAEAQTVELAHESLLVTWQQLRHWLEESGEERRLRLELDEAAAFWERRGERDDETWSEAEIASARHRASQLAVEVPPRVARFLAAGEARHRRLRRRARRRRAAIIAATLAIAAVALVLAGFFREQQLAAERQAQSLRLAARNAGRVDLQLQPFDWRDGRAVPVPVAEFAALQVSVYRPDPLELELPGTPVAPELRRISPRGPGRFLVEAPGGPIYLRVDGRGRAGEVCAASWLRIMAFPGYAERGAVESMVLQIPTCAASNADTVIIPAGPFFYGGTGARLTELPFPTEPERIATSPAYRIDLYELSNAVASPFHALARYHRYPLPEYGAVSDLPGSAEPRSPLTSLDAFQAAAICRYFGKRLPTDEEWAKAARGGRDGPMPHRLFPWGDDDRPCANLEGTSRDGYVWVAPVDAFPCGRSPYGLFNVAGNASEWVARHGQTDTSELRVVRGGSLESPRELLHGTTIFRNERRGSYFDFTIGVRCVADLDPVQGSTWTEH